MPIEAPYRMETAKKSMQVEGFEVSVWKDGDGLMRMEIKNMNGDDVFHSLNLPWESQASSGRLAFTSNRYIIEAECAPDAEDHRESPRFLREAGKDPVFRAWFMKRNTKRNVSPEQWAAAIEEIRREQGRDTETGVLLAVASDAS